MITRNLMAGVLFFVAIGLVRSALAPAQTEEIDPTPEIVIDLAGELSPFVSDGCSGFMSPAWDLVTGEPPPWEALCVKHDRLYWAGGTAAERLAADEALHDGIEAMGHPNWADVVWSGIRPGGHPMLPFPWRWGFGYEDQYPLELYYAEMS